ncbi:MAG: SDR family NAD(P)-dependent oxidoreductase [Frankia sp.]
MELSLAGKIALITGGSRGIGRAIATALAAEGCAVGICGRDTDTLAKAAADLRAAASGVVFTAIADVAVPGGVEGFVEAAAAELGGVDLLVANVGGAVGGSLLESTDDDWTTTFALNTGHAVSAIRAVTPHMRARGGGAVAIISSISGWKPSPRAQYGAAKAAEIYLAGAFARELADDHIRVNTVSPGSILFPGGGWERFSQTNPETYAQFTTRDFPTGRLGTAEEIADVVTFLLSDRARWINGAHIPVDGAQNRPSANGY